MNISYSPTYELKNDCGYSSPMTIKFNNIEELKDKISYDGQSDDYKIACLNIIVNDVIGLYFDFPNTIKVFYYDNEMSYQIVKFDNYSLFDLIKNLDTYIHIN